MRIITLCGSSKYKKQFRQMETMLSLQGYIVLCPIFFTEEELAELEEDQLEILQEAHQFKLNMCDEIFVIDMNGYIDEITRESIEFAENNRKGITYYSKMSFPRYDTGHDLRRDKDDI